MSNTDLRAERIDYLKHCFSENLNHARHVENERLTFTSIYIALVVGAVAVVFGLDNNWVAFWVTLLLTCFSVMAFLLNFRWQEIFDKHKAKVKTCEQEWRNLIEQKDACPGGYYFGTYEGAANARKDKHNGLTRRMFYILYGATLAALAILTVYLFFQARESAAGGGFYFSVSARRELENALVQVVKEALK